MTGVKETVYETAEKTCNSFQTFTESQPIIRVIFSICGGRDMGLLMLNLYLSGICVGAYGFDAMTDAHDELPFFAHRVDKLHGNETGIIRFRELPRRAIQRSTKPVSLQITTIICNNTFCEI